MCTSSCSWPCRNAFLTSSCHRDHLFDKAKDRTKWIVIGFTIGLRIACYFTPTSWPNPFSTKWAMYRSVEPQWFSFTLKIRLHPTTFMVAKDVTRDQVYTILKERIVFFLHSLSPFQIFFRLSKHVGLDAKVDGGKGYFVATWACGVWDLVLRLITNIYDEVQRLLFEKSMLEKYGEWWVYQ